MLSFLSHNLHTVAIFVHRATQGQYSDFLYAFQHFNPFLRMDFTFPIILWILSIGIKCALIFHTFAFLFLIYPSDNDEEPHFPKGCMTFLIFI